MRNEDGTEFALYDAVHGAGADESLLGGVFVPHAIAVVDFEDVFRDATARLDFGQPAAEEVGGARVVAVDAREAGLPEEADERIARGEGEQAAAALEIALLEGGPGAAVGADEGRGVGEVAGEDVVAMEGDEDVGGEGVCGRDVADGVAAGFAVPIVGQGVDGTNPVGVSDEGLLDAGRGADGRGQR